MMVLAWCMGSGTRQLHHRYLLHERIGQKLELVGVPAGKERRHQLPGRAQHAQEQVLPQFSLTNEDI
jgi:hypothetical protein